jgi:hypothetical protein
MRIRLVAAGAIGFAVLAAGPTASAAPRGGSLTFPDATGEIAAGPDIVSVAVANDDLRNLTFTVTLANRPTLGASEVLLSVNSDNNLSTGNDQWDGAEYAIDLTTKDGAGLARWTGSQWDWSIPQTSLVASYAAGAASFTINAAELGNTKTFTFVAGAGENEQYDWAPESGEFSYTLRISPPVTKTVAKAASKPVKKKKKKKNHC